MFACTRTNLGHRGRGVALRVGVWFAGIALLMALALYELGAAESLGWVLLFPTAVSIYSLLSGTFGLCLYHGMKGMRATDHGSEVVLDGETRSRMLRRAALAVSASLLAGSALTAAFVASV